jgi:3-dehydroquinate synthase
VAESKVISSGFYPIYIGSEIYSFLINFLQLPHYKKSRFFILVDRNTRKHCLEKVISRLELPGEPGVIEIPVGEQNKNIQTCAYIWNELIKNHADRHSVLMNLGGGVLTDLGGFAAATFKRGIRFIHIPTTLIGQIDAAIGGKVGIDHEDIKNQIGLFANPEAVIIDHGFLGSLSRKDFVSGYAEILKHGLVHDAPYWHEQKDVRVGEIDNWIPVIARSVEIKTSIVRIDPFDRKYRRVLNFGHTIGHALESAALRFEGDSLSHGEAIAAGMICETYISYRKGMITDEALEDISSGLKAHFGYLDCFRDLRDHFMPFILEDKKNEEEEIMFTLLSGIGHAVINQRVSSPLIQESLDYYENVYTT